VEDVRSESSALGHLIGGYFHEEWMTEGADTQAVVRRFVDDNQNHPEVVAQARNEGLGLLEGTPDDEQLTSALRALGLRFAPSFHGLTHRQWLLLVVDCLDG
jgi:hypothetical protein